MSNDLTETESRRRKWLTGKRLIGIAITVLLVLRIGIEFIPIRVHISPETTVIEGPLREDGTPDYAAYLNEQWSKGVTPDENAAVDLIHAFGPGIINEDIREEYFDQLGIEMPPLEGDYYVDFFEFMEQDGADWRSNDDESERIEAMIYDAVSRPWSADEFPDVAEWLAANEIPLKASLTASGKPRYHSPLVTPPTGGLIAVNLDATQQTRDAARLLVTSAMYELDQGNIDRAHEHILACHQLSRLVSESPILISQLVAYANASIAAVGDEQLILSGELSAEQASEYRRQFSLLRNYRSMGDVIDNGERFASLDAMILFHRGQISGEDIGEQVAMQWAFNPNPGMVLFNRNYDRIKTAMEEADPTERVRRLAAIDWGISPRTHSDYLKTIFTFLVSTRLAMSEQIGKTLIVLLAPALAQAANAEERTIIRQQLIDTGYAIAEYRADAGSFPDSLEILVPGQLEESPIDPYSGVPYRYELTDGGFLLWSVGPDGLDDGGRDDDGSDDIPFGDRPDWEQ